MSFGVAIRGAMGQTLIDDVNPCLHLAATGSYGGQSMNEMVVMYPAAINSPYEPYVFFRPNGPHQIYLFRHLGSPGNWTGFAFWQLIYRDTDPPVWGGVWKACAVMQPPTGGWGMQVFDGQHRIMFDSNRDIVRVVGGAQTWNRYSYNPNWPGGQRLQTWALPYTYGNSTYFLASHFNLKSSNMLHPPAVGFLYGAMTTIFVSAFVSEEQSWPFNWPLMVIA